MSTRKPQRHRDRHTEQINQTLRHARNTPSPRGERKRAARKQQRQRIKAARARYRREFEALSPSKRLGSQGRRLRRLMS